MTADTFNNLNAVQAELLKTGETMIELLGKMNPELQKEYAPKVQAMISKSKELIADKK